MADEDDSSSPATTLALYSSAASCDDSLQPITAAGTRSWVAVGVGVEGGVNDVSDDMEARARRLFFNGVT